MSQRQSRAHMAAWAKIWNLARGSSIEKTRRFWSSSRDLSLFHSHGYSINRQNHRYQNLDTSPGFPSSFSSSRFVLATTIKNLIYQDYFLFNWLIMKKISSTNSIHQRQNAKSFTYLHMYFFRLTQNSLRQTFNIVEVSDWCNRRAVLTVTTETNSMNERRQNLR
jgi:hypothetical protein